MGESRTNLENLQNSVALMGPDDRRVGYGEKGDAKRV